MTTRRLEQRARIICDRENINILGVDLSLRATGFSIININSGFATMKKFGVLTNPAFAQGFDGLELSSRLLNKNTIMPILAMITKEQFFDVVLIEVPASPQSAVSALAIGMLWGAVQSIAKLPQVILVEPSQLKLWSGSKKGDGKSIVKEKVEQRINLGPAASDDNIVDAVGLCFMFSDMVTKARYEINSNQ